MYQKINSIRTSSSRNAEFWSKIMSFLPLKFEHTNYIFLIRRSGFTIMTLQSIGSKFFAKILEGN